MKSTNGSAGFTLTEVVVAIGIISFAVIAILGLVPLGLSTGRSSQDESRAPQIAQDIFASLSSQARSTFPSLTIYQPATTGTNAFTYPIALDNAHTYDTVAADNDGRLISLTKVTDAMNYPYQVLIDITPDPVGFDPGFAAKVTVRVVSPPSPDPTLPLGPNQTSRAFVRILTKY